MRVWYLNAWSDPLEQQIRGLLQALVRYDPATLEDEPELTRDLLKQLYQYLVPRHLRHDLGEYYNAWCELLDFGRPPQGVEALAGCAHKIRPA